MKDLNWYRDESLRIAVEHGFTDASFLEDLMLIVTEVAEVAEEYRAGSEPAYQNYEEDNRDPSKWKPVGIPSELADVLIRVFHLCGKHNIDIQKAVDEKLKFNESRPFKHNKKI